jgi:hypothetical protein
VRDADADQISEGALIFGRTIERHGWILVTSSETPWLLNRRYVHLRCEQFLGQDTELIIILGLLCTIVAAA